MASNTPEWQKQYSATTAGLAGQTATAGVLIVDTTKNTVAVMDGTTLGGHPLAKESRKIQSGSGALRVNGGDAGDLSRDIMLTLDDTLIGSQTWDKRVSGDVPTDPAKLQEILADVPIGGLVYFDEGLPATPPGKTELSVVNDTANEAKTMAQTAQTSADEAKAAAAAAQTAADGKLGKTETAAAATKLATARTIQTTLDSITAASFDGSANATPGVTGTLALANGGTGATTAANALSNLGGIAKSGSRGQLAGNETATAVSGAQTITATSADCINISTSGAVTLTFTAAAATIRAVKALSITATAATTLTVSGAVWANKGSAPTWGNAGTTLVLIAHFVGGRVVLTVADNTQ